MFYDSRKRKLSNVMKALILLIFLILPQGSLAMSILNSLKTCVFSEVKARLVLNGKPLKNAKVTRQWEWHKRRSDEAVTDTEGYVTFPAVYESSITRLLPAEIVIGQSLSVEVENEAVIFWQSSKREAVENSEYAGSSFVVICELSAEKILIEDYGSLIATMCKLGN